tara:strand:+ start:313 stop:567 length:255 start_codon:yes stop_codon:yes gene_type:complete
MLALTFFLLIVNMAPKLVITQLKDRVKTHDLLVSEHDSDILKLQKDVKELKKENSELEKTINWMQRNFEYLQSKLQKQGILKKK